MTGEEAYSRTIETAKKPFNLFHRKLCWQKACKQPHGHTTNGCSQRHWPKFSAAADIQKLWRNALTSKLATKHFFVYVGVPCSAVACGSSSANPRCN